MANQHTALHGGAFDKVTYQLEADGLHLMFACTYTDDYPKDLGWTGKEGGWEMRRKLKAWCVKHEIVDYKIVRNTGYVRDLHGDVYELWARQSDRTPRR
jgi:hypothetical protein